jgi:hypothetical protein
MKEQIEKQIELLTEESHRVKEFINMNGFDCTSAPFIIVHRYREELKEHIYILRENLKDFE